jgi:hypothetical protein
MNTELDPEQLLHEPTDDCDGHQIDDGFGGGPCPECGSPLCPCQLAYGHDCE